MGRIKIELPNESFYVEIEGDTPTVKDQIAINKLIRERRRSLKELERVGTYEQERCFCPDYFTSLCCVETEQGEVRKKSWLSIVYDRHV